MYPIYDPGEVFYKYSFSSGRKTLIGEKSGFVWKINSLFNCKKGASEYNVNAYEHVGKTAMNPNDVEYKDKPLYYEINGWTTKTMVRTYTRVDTCFKDGYGRVLDPKNYVKDVVSLRTMTIPRYYGDLFHWYWRRKEKKHQRERQGRNRHSGYCLRGTNYSYIHGYLREMDMFSRDKEMVEECHRYHLYPRMPKFYYLYEGYGVTNRNGWKSQYKANKQYNIHRRMNDSRSIKK